MSAPAGRFYATIGSRTVVPKQKNMAAVAAEAKGWARKGYSPVIRKEEGSMVTGVVRVRCAKGQPVEATFEPHPFNRDTTVPAWAVAVTNLLNDKETHGTA